VNCLVTIGGEKRPARCDFARASDLADIGRWRHRVGRTKSGIVEDILEFAAFARKRWRSYGSKRRTAASLDSLKKMVNADPSAEVAVFAVIRATYGASNRVVGFCLFRRTWCNHLAIDFLSTNPEGSTAKKPKIQAAGVALAGFVCAIAKALSCPVVWLETTEGSAGVYGRWFGRSAVKDLLALPAADYLVFWNNLQADWKNSGFLDSECAV
jgi:hypothetical protein